MMADIYTGELQKRYVRMSIWLLKKKLGECSNSKNIKQDMENCGNIVFNRIYQHFINTTKEIKEEPQRNAIRDVGELGIWIPYKDTAYKEIIVYMLNEVIKDKELCAAIKKQVKPPKEWYPNVWHESKKQSDEERKKGTVMKYGKGFAEGVFTPGEQAKRQKRIR